MENQEELEAAFLQFYQGLLRTTHSDRRKVSHTILHEGIVLNGEQQQLLSMAFTGEDVRQTLFDIDNEKLLEVIDVVLDFFQIGRLLKQVNDTTLCLIPKCDQPIDVTQFRPIACCNVLYKVISKMLCTRLKRVLPFLVNPVQNAFIEERVIFHKIFLCHDILKHYKRKHQPARCTVKVDLKKAYDSLNWQFIKELLISLKFPM
ncbi:uncharacterized protein LOC104907369 [Beta vulgaris subsp. vulgaris]|uniref:uncharacterized protein LOC104907369 n=1 Tax=Beta vulgaris subsp. vulgaris TaxID=3555 RepID=UPI0020368AE1|nr:uncharacterized protein LOC104907369 [Beta vulgaris subsp. vulgaris]